jgi:hypothetical protein
LVRLDKRHKENGLYFLPFGENLKIKEVVLGCRFNHGAEKEKILELTNQLDVKIIPTREGWEDYRIHQCGTKTKLYQ